MKAGGVRGLWQGTGPSVIRVGLGAALQFVVLEHVKSLLSVPLANGTSHLSAMGAAISGGMYAGCYMRCFSALAGAFFYLLINSLPRCTADAGFSRAVATVLLCPITVVKTRMEYATTDPSVPRYK